MKKTIKKILHKWHWFWFQAHLKWLMKDYKDEVWKAAYKAIDEMLNTYVSPYMFVTTSVEEMTNDLINGGRQV